MSFFDFLPVEIEESNSAANLDKDYVKFVHETKYKILSENLENMNPNSKEFDSMLNTAIEEFMAFNDLDLNDVNLHNYLAEQVKSNFGRLRVQKKQQLDKAKNDTDESVKYTKKSAFRIHKEMQSGKQKFWAPNTSFDQCSKNCKNPNVQEVEPSKSASEPKLKNDPDLYVEMAKDNRGFQHQNAETVKSLETPIKSNADQGIVGKPSVSLHTIDIQK